MVGTSVVKEKVESYKSHINKFSQSVTDCKWDGESYNNYNKISSDFVKNANTLDNQFSAFTAAIEAYNKYIEAKSQKRELTSQLNNLDTEDENYESSKSYYERQINSWGSALSNAENTINSNLGKITDVVVKGSIGLKDVGDAAERIKAALDWAIGVANDDSIGYSQATRNGNPNYDCSSFMYYTWQEAGTGVGDAYIGTNVGTTRTMRQDFTAHGFVWIPMSEAENDLRPGDILLDEDEHTEMYIGNNQNVGAHDDYDGRNGDSSGEELDVGDYYRGSWDGVLRYVGTDK